MASAQTLQIPENVRFIALDVETANRNASSICQVGLAMVLGDGNIQTAGYLIDPEEEFDFFNVKLHGIDADMVANAATFPQAMHWLRPALTGITLIQHSSFDKRAFNAACTLYEMPDLACDWLDSVSIARQAWPQFKGNGGHGLGNLKRELALDFQHHDAEEDARAAAQVVLLAEAETGRDFRDLAAPAKRKSTKTKQPITRDANQDGLFYGHRACFTGRMTRTRAQIVERAAHAGFDVQISVSHSIHILVVGDQSVGAQKTTKHLQCEALISRGANIHILEERAFFEMINLEPNA